MTNKRRFEFSQGSSDKFWEIEWISSVETERSWRVISSYGRIGNKAQISSKSFYSKKAVDHFISTKISEKLKKGYVDVTPDISKEKVLVEKKKKEIKLPRVWSRLRDQLLAGELAVYEKYDDSRTKQRRNDIASKYKVLVEIKEQNQELKDVNKAAWLYLRYTYFRYLSSMGIYNPGVSEALIDTVSQLRDKLLALPDNQKKAIDESLKKFTNKVGPLSLSECEQGVNAFLEEMILEIKEREKTGPGGISRKSARIIARRLKIKDRQ